MSDRLVTVATFWSPVEANMARNRLTDGGIKSILSDETCLDLAFHLVNAIGGVEFQVWEQDAEAALELLERHGTQTDPPPSDDAQGDADPGTETAPPLRRTQPTWTPLPIRQAVPIWTSRQRTKRARMNSSSPSASWMPFARTALR